MDLRTGFYLLLKDVENPSFPDNSSWWGMFSSYVYSTEDEVPQIPHLALKGELLEALELTEQPQDSNRISLHAVKQFYQRLECNIEDLKPVEKEEMNLLLAVDSYYERCRIIEDGRLSYACTINEGDEVNVTIKDIQKEVSAVVRYKGLVPPFYGTVFGVEIMDGKYRRCGNSDGASQCKRYFKCQPASGLFVSLDSLCFEGKQETSKEAPEDETQTKVEKTETKNKNALVNDDNDKLINNFDNDNNATNSTNKLMNDPSKEENEVNVKKEIENENKDECDNDNNAANSTNKLIKVPSEEENEVNAEKENEKKDERDSNGNEFHKSEIETEGLEVKAIIEELQQQLLKVNTELEEKESLWKQEAIEWEMKMGLQLVTHNDLHDQVMQLEKRLNDVTVTKCEVEERLNDEQKRWKKQMKSFSREWEEFERRLLEERTMRTSLEEQLAQLQLQLDQETHQKHTVEAELEQVLATASQQENEFQRHREYLEYRIQELENTPHENTHVTEQSNEARDWIISRDEIQLREKTLGTGAWGQVVEGSFRRCPVAVKQIHDLILSPHNRRLFEREMSIASRCRHPCLLQFVGATNDNGNPLFITELMDTNLRTILETRPLTEDEIVTISCDVAMALNYLHLNKPLPIIHRDISSANVLLCKRDDRWRAKVSDYGAANFMRQCRTINPGAVIYSAPEALSVHQTPKIDVFSFGLLLCEMAIRELPVPNQTQQQVAMVANQQLRDLISQCIQHDHKKRPTMDEILRTLDRQFST